jgi:hypothetical protein
MLIKSLAIAALLLLFVQLYVRLAPLPQGRLSARPGPMDEGVHPRPGGIKVVRSLADLPDDAVAKLAEIAAATPRTRQVGEDPIAFVTRSKLWGFPDIALIWTDGAYLHLHSHLVFGTGDMGVNAARVARWFDALERAGEG